MPGNLVRGAVDSLANSRGRSGRHILIGLGLTLGAVAASAAMARFGPKPEPVFDVYSDYEEPALEQPKRSLFSMFWPPLFLALTLSGLRIWNAPKSAERTQALTLWGVAQGLNAVWMALGPRRLGGGLAAATAALGTAVAYVWRARRVDAPAADLVAPYVGWIGIANVLSQELGRKPPDARTLH